MRTVLFLALTPALLLAQNWNSGDQSIRAQIRGGGSSDSGKCTGEVEVDGVAEIAIRGEEGRIRTLSGNPARWRRLECTSALPRTISEFRFKGVDGRGRQDLAQDPRSNNGMAVIRIEDPKGGADGYTFDLEWRGSGNFSGSGNSGWGNSNSGSGWGNSNSGSGWGNSNSGSGWGNNNNNSGWGNGWGNNFSYRGNGRGSFSHSNGQRQDIRGAYVTMERNTGIAQVYFSTSAGPEALQFNGRILRIDRDTVTVDIQSARNRGEKVTATGTIRMQISSDRRVRAITSDGDAAGGRFNVNYRE
ncbi:MAG: hypothetical protein HY821_03060 [Acidobacteria bacterium]|nr:hypothetical protein [Acidobacteriota bacterium]